MKTKTKLFDKNLYIEGLHQLKAPAIITLVIFGITSIMMPILQNSDTNFVRYFISTNYFLPLIVYLCAPIFTFYLFSFLFKRKSSDFYHSLAPKRITLYTSFTASIMTVLTLIILICCALMIIFTYLIIGARTSVDFASTILPTILNLIAGSALMTSGILIGCALSGKFISALATAVVILFYPRIFISAILSTLKSGIAIVDSSYFDIPFGNNCNALTGAVFNFYTEYKSVIYSLILALIYFIIGLIAFNRKKPEFAGKTSMGRISQTVFRTLFCMILCLPAIIMIFQINHNYDYYISDFSYSATELTIFVPTIIRLYFFAAICYFLFEIFTNRSFKTIPRALLEFGYVILLNIAIIGGMNLCEGVITAYQPTEKEIDSIKLITYQEDYEYYGSDIENFLYYAFDNEYFYEDRSYKDYGYNNLSYSPKDMDNLAFLKDFSFSNDKAEKIFCDALKETIKGKKFGYNRSDSILYELGEYNMLSSYVPPTDCISTPIIVGFTENGVTKYRNVYLTYDEFKAICKQLQNDENLNKKLFDFAEKIKKTENIEIESNLQFIGKHTKYTTDKKYLTAVFRNAVKESKKSIYDMLYYYYFDNYQNYKMVITDENDRKNILFINDDMENTMDAYYEMVISRIDKEKIISQMNDDKYTLDFYNNDLEPEDENSYYDYKLKTYKKAELIEYIKNYGLKKIENSVIMYADVYMMIDDADGVEYEETINDFLFYIEKDKIEEFFTVNTYSYDEYEEEYYDY